MPLEADGDEAPPIGSYGFLSDGRSSALVGRDGSIDWACLHGFDGPSTFAALLDRRHGGAFAVVLSASVLAVRRRYLPSTMVLETSLVTETGIVRCTDALDLDDRRADSCLLRRLEVVEGSVVVDVGIRPRFGYGATMPWLRDHQGRCSAVGGAQAIVMAATAPLVVDDDRVRVADAVEMTAAGPPLDIVLVAQQPHRLDVDAADAGLVEARLAATASQWERWSADTVARGPYAGLVRRSALVLQGLRCAPTGGILAAPTTSLPEVVGGSANWDYRYCWVRDATLAVDALDAIGHHEVARAHRDFVIRSSAGHGREVQVVYGPYGERALPERELGQLSGWRRSAPVRVGNGAVDQLQLDKYGHLLDLAHLWNGRHGGISPPEWRFLASVVDAAADDCARPDAGVWERRGPRHHYVHSKVMAWVALDRGIRLVEDHGLEDLGVARWQAVRDQLRHEIECRGVDPERGNFVQHFATRAVDASLLRLPLVGFVAADDERMLSTTAAIIDELGVPPDGLLRRYRAEDPADAEGVFLLCSCWLVEVLVLQGRRAEALALFEVLVQAGNDLGLYSEQLDPASGELLGNFPQAFTHLGLIGANRALFGPG